MTGGVGRTTDATAATAAAPDASRERQRLQAACREFESFFIKEILKGLKSTVLQGSGEPGIALAGSEIQAGLADDQFADWLSQSGGLGLGRMLFESLVKQLKEEPAAATPRPATPRHGAPRPVDRAGS
ncbi:MAG: hypothetical protein NUV93_01615 [Firmicutes bacterium]|jgi:Rod binding domain-containing protein|nr:hypothetical protein [Bacillota bacterium]